MPGTVWDRQVWKSEKLVLFRKVQGHSSCAPSRPTFLPRLDEALLLPDTLHEGGFLFPTASFSSEVFQNKTFAISFCQLWAKSPPHDSLTQLLWLYLWLQTGFQKPGFNLSPSNNVSKKTVLKEVPEGYYNSRSRQCSFALCLRPCLAWFKGTVTIVGILDRTCAGMRNVFFPLLENIKAN